MKQQSGLGLVEIIVAIAIIGIAFVALAFSQVYSFQTTGKSQKTAIAKDIASKKMEEIRGLGYGTYKGCASGTTNTTCVTSNQAVTNQPGYSLSWTITNQPKNPSDLTKTVTLNNPGPPLVGVTVTVSWQEGSSTKNYVLSSYLSCADAGDFSSTNVPCPLASMR
jgi:prepilin-type N-terminal cleavage/methylation domain-containing protein